MKKLLFCLAAACGLFGAGFFIAETKRTPYPQLFGVYDAVRRNPIVHTIYFRIRDPFGRSAPPPLAPARGVTFDGRWGPARDRQHREGEDAEQQRARQNIAGLAYLQSYEKAPPLSGVVLHAEERVIPGINLYVTGSGPNAFLMDMNGNLLHQWNVPFDEAFPNYERKRDIGVEYWRYAHLYEDGSLVAIYPRHGILRVDRDSNIIWKVPGEYHHVFDVAEDGTIVVTGSRFTHKPDWRDPGNVAEDLAVYLDPDTGEEIRTISFMEAIDNSAFAALEGHNVDAEGDPLHTNTIEILDGRFESRNPAFRKGNILTCFRHIDTIGIVDPDTEQLVWALTGLWDMQHRPTFLDDGSLMVFNNNNRTRQSQVLIVDPITQQVLWSYEDDVFFTSCCGVAWPLPNDNVLITESVAGRAFEVTRDGEIVWEFYNPERQGEDDAAIATLFELYRYPIDYADAWLD